LNYINNLILCFKISNLFFFLLIFMTDKTGLTNAKKATGRKILDFIKFIRKNDHFLSLSLFLLGTNAIDVVSQATWKRNALSAEHLLLAEDLLEETKNRNKNNNFITQSKRKLSKMLILLTLLFVFSLKLLAFLSHHNCFFVFFPSKER